MNQSEFARCMAVLSAGVGRDVPVEMMRVWFSVLGDVSESQLQAGIIKTLQSYKFSGFPPIALIREHCGCESIAVNLDDKANAAWSTLLQAMRRIGGYQSVQWDDPAIPAAIEAVAQSWASLCEMPSAELHAYVRPRWMQSYKSALAMGVKGSTVSPGILASDAGRLGGSVPEPVRIGEKPMPVVGFSGQESRANEPARLLELKSIDDESRYSPLVDDEHSRRLEQQRAALQRMVTTRPMWPVVDSAKSQDQ